jgi:Tfp pilus assembly protein PilN
MRIAINLATQPFRKDRAAMVASGAVAMVLVISLGALVSIDQVDRQQSAGLRAEVARLNRRLRTVSAEEQKLETMLHEPHNATVLETSVFINDLIYHKSVSWSRLFADLEKTVPYNVKVMALHPAVNSRNEVMLDMTVGAEKPEAIEDLLRAFEKSPIFGPVFQRTMQAPTQSEPLYRIRMTVPYAQKF